MAWLQQDGCSFFPENWFGHSLTQCCDTHDAAFATGTTLQEFWDANVALLECVAPFDPIAAALMFVGCTTGGALFFFFGRKRRE